MIIGWTYFKGKNPLGSRDTNNIALMNIMNWFKKQITALSLALSRVEEVAITQKKDSLGDGVKSVMDINAGRLSNDMMKGKITKQVQELRWRMYKVLYHSRNKQILLVIRL